MDLQLLKQRLRDSPFSAHSDYFVERARPCIDIEITGEQQQNRRSRFGGSPDLPLGMDWPQSPHGPYRFIAQIACEELPVIGAGLPAEGLLSLFVGLDSDDGKFFWRSPGYVQAFLFSPGTKLAAVAPPESVSFGASRAVQFRSGVDLPFDRYQVNDWPLGGDYDLLDAYDRFRDSLHTSPHYLLGYPSHCSLGYDPTPGPGWQSLITLGSDGDLWWEWHDGDKLMVFIETQRLAKHDFEGLASDGG